MKEFALSLIKDKLMWISIVVLGCSGLGFYQFKVIEQKNILPALLPVFLANLIWIIIKNIRWSLGLRKLSAVLPITKDDTDIAIKCSIKEEMGGSNPETLRAYVHSAETLALGKAAEAIAPYGKKIKLNYDYFYAMRIDNNLLLIGSGAHNEISGSVINIINRETNIKYCKGGSGHSYIEYHNNETIEKFKCRHQMVGGRRQVTNDYGLIIRAPYGINNKVVLLLAGIHMHGTLAALEVALSEKFQERIKEKNATYFVQIVQANITGDGLQIITPQHADWKYLPFEKIERLG